MGSHLEDRDGTWHRGTDRMIFDMDSWLEQHFPQWTGRQRVGGLELISCVELRAGCMCSGYET